MNPLRWRDEHILAWLTVMLIGAIVGFVASWIESPFFKIAIASDSGDPFGDWLGSVGIGAVWPNSVFGVVLAALGFYALMLTRVPLADSAQRKSDKRPTAAKPKKTDQPKLL